MKEEKASSTAENVAALRAAESLKPEDKRVCYDPLARHFLGAKFRVFGRSRFLTRLALWDAERRSPGSFGCLVGRTRYIDDCLKACIDDRIEQLVILGAGYDTRAYRFDKLKEKVKVFEVDHPATQKVKIEKVSRMLGSLPGHVVYVSVDFEKERLDKKLFESGYDKSLKTLFIWEGVTMYLTAEAVDETLAFVAGNSGKGSSIIFNYIFWSVLDGTCELEYAPKVRKAHERGGEPFKFGIEKGKIDEFLSSRGFHQVKNVTGEYFKDAYFKGVNQNRQVCCCCGFVRATVKPRG
jgi:methyltransferase (TIGR00027 family)